MRNHLLATEGIVANRIQLRQLSTCTQVAKSLAPVLAVSLAVAISLLLTAVPALAHDTRDPVEADHVLLNTPSRANGIAFEISISGQTEIGITHDPRDEDTGILVYATGQNSGSSGLIELDRTLWAPITDGYEYTDPSGTRGGVTSVILTPGNLEVLAGGANWPWDHTGPLDNLWFTFQAEEEVLCAQFVLSGGPPNATLVSNVTRKFEAINSAKPVACEEQVCGNGIREIPEACDDGNTQDGDDCAADCSEITCEASEFSTTLEGIETVIFEGYRCTDCHSLDPLIPSTEFEFDLTKGNSYDYLVDILATRNFTPTGQVIPVDRVEPGEPIASYLFEALAAKISGSNPNHIIPMPISGNAISQDHLDAIEKWIRGGAPRDGVVEGTAEDLGTCLPPPTPLKINPPPVRPEGAVQLRSTAWDLPPQSEDELCYPTYYDFTQTDLIPADSIVPCPGYFSTANNPSGNCFSLNRRILRQDAQSHHSIIELYIGDDPLTDPEDEDHQFGPFIYRPNDPSDPKSGTSCDPTDIDPTKGYNPDCSGNLVSGVACTGYGPTGYTLDAFGFAGSQEPFVDNTYPQGVYGLLPMAGVVTWNSHAFNLTETGTTMAQYLDIYLAGSEDRVVPAAGIFDISRIFIQRVPPFETREYCKTYTLGPDDPVRDANYDDFTASVFELGSHTHQWGVQFRIWGPPQAVCADESFPGATGLTETFACDIGEECGCSPGDPEDLIYESFQYTDPVQLYMDPPLVVGPTAEDRTFLFCSVYDNGSTPQSPAVKQRSTSATSPPFAFGSFALQIGGPCADEQTTVLASGIFPLYDVPGVACMDGPNKGLPCGNESANFCDLDYPGFSFDGQCDACSVMGGFTTNDEMFILTGSYFQGLPFPEPSSGVLALTVLLSLGALARQRRNQSL